MYDCRDGYPCQSCRSVLECPAAKMCHLSTKDQYVCQSHHRIAEAVTGVLGRAQFPSGPFYHPSSSRGRFGHPREAAVRAGNFPDSNGISDDFKRQNRSHETEPVPIPPMGPIYVRSGRYSLGLNRLRAFSQSRLVPQYNPQRNYQSSSNQD